MGSSLVRWSETVCPAREKVLSEDADETTMDKNFLASFASIGKCFSFFRHQLSTSVEAESGMGMDW
jgi:hypothetical protein